MRRILFTVLASCVVLAAVPVIATAHGDEHHRGRHHEHHDRREHARRHHHRARVRHEHFSGDRGDRGDNPGQPGTAGTVTSFTGGVLTITLTNGNTVSGQVTQSTELRCEMQEPEFRDDDQGPGAGGNTSDGDNGSGPGSGDDGGDGRGGPGPGDDRGDNDDQMCTTIAVGMMVEKAELGISSAGAFWEEVELIS
jgi:Ni/Co efflux regulator RcnB